MDIDEIKPTPYSQTDFAENEAIHLFTNVIERKRVKLDIKSRDKYPNYDGYIELVDETNHSLGKMEVQVKAIAKGTKYYYCSLENISYSNTTTLPIILILSDIDSKIVYWKHLTATNARLSDKGKSYIFELTINDKLCFENDYFNQWLIIINEYKKRIKEYAKIEAMLQMSSYSIVPKNLADETITYFQIFIDKLNTSIEKEFPFIKRRLFPKFWKIGVSVMSFGREMSFGLYGIPNGKSDLLVKEIDQSTKPSIFSNAFLQSFYSSTHEDSPERLAYSFIFDYLNLFIKNEIFLPACKILAEEYVYSIVSKCYFMFGLKKSINYDIDLIQRGFNSYLPIWISIAMSKEWYPHHMRYVDIIYLSHFPHDDVDEEFQHIINTNSAYNIQGNIELGSDKVDFYTFVSCLSYLKNSNIDCVGTLMVDPNYTLVKEKKSFYISEAYSRGDIKKMCKSFYSNIDTVVNDFLSYYSFPEYFYTPSDCVSFIIIHIGDRLDTFMPVTITTLKADKQNTPLHDRRNVIILEDNDTKTESIWNSLKDGFSYQGYVYKIISWSNSIDIEIFEDRPFYTYLYKYLDEKLKEQSKRLGSDRMFFI